MRCWDVNMSNRVPWTHAAGAKIVALWSASELQRPIHRRHKKISRED